MRGKRIEIDTNKVYHSNNYGDFKIIEEAGRSNSNHLLVKIKFIDTGYETISQYNQVIIGNVRDKSVSKKRSNTIRSNTIEIDTDKIYYTKYSGNFKIIEEVGRDKSRHLLVKIKFIDTGYETTCQYSQAIIGNVRDKSVSRKCNSNKGS